MSRRGRGREDGRSGNGHSGKWLDYKRGIKVNFIPRKGRRTRALPHFARAEEVGRGIDCRVCGARYLSLVSHVNRVHDLSAAEYRAKYGDDAPMMAPELLAKWKETARKVATRRHDQNVGICEECGEEYQRGKDARRSDQYCSNACTWEALSKARAQPANVARMQASVTEGRKKHQAQMTADKRARQTLPCVVCGKLHTFARLVKQLRWAVCSYKCRTAYARQLAERGGDQ